MKYYLAPMEGLTTYIFRNALHRHYGGCDRFFAPFICDHNFNHKEKRDLIPEHNEGIELIPQILGNNAEEFLLIAQKLQEYGYKEVNLNVGCPSGTVTSKHRGAGFLAYPEELERFLDTIFDRSPLPISVKTRLGFSSLEEWDGLVKLYARYPITELIIHTRIGKEFYKGETHPKEFLKAVEQIKTPLCYNGDITSVADLDYVQSIIPQMDHVMIGRGAVAHPDIFRLLQGQSGTNLKTLRAFHDEVYAGYQEWDGGPMPTLFKMKELWCYLYVNFPEKEKAFKKIKKAKSFADYEAAVREIF